jgi:hypothetical protein
LSRKINTILSFFNNSSIISDNMSMNGLTIREIAEKLGITPNAAKIRIYDAGIEPKDHAGKTNIYDESIVDQIRDTPGPGRPKKAKKPEK